MPDIQIDSVIENSCLLAGSGNTEIVQLEEDEGDFDSDENNYFVINAKEQNSSIWEEWQNNAIRKTAK